MARRAGENSSSAKEREQATIAAADGERKTPAVFPWAASGSGGSRASSAGIQNRAPETSARPPVRSITVAPARRAAGACRDAKAGEPVKNTNRARSKVDSSTI